MAASLGPLCMRELRRTPTTRPVLRSTATKLTPQFRALQAPLTRPIRRGRAAGLGDEIVHGEAGLGGRDCEAPREGLLAEGRRRLVKGAKGQVTSRMKLLVMRSMTSE